MNDLAPLESAPLDFPVSLPEIYALKELLRKSDGGETWDVFDRLKKRKLVLKRFKTSFYGDGPSVERFKADIDAWESLRSAGISLPAVIAAGRDDDFLWVLRENHSVLRALSDVAAPAKPIKEGFAVKRFTSLSSLLAALHQTGFVHGNLKPKNIFFGSDEIFLVDADFGRFRDPFFFGEGFDANRLGSTDYLAPEQHLERSEEYRAAMDIWSLTACLVYAVTGTSPREFDESGVSEPLRNILRKGLAENPANRFGSMDDLRTALEQIADLARPVFSFPAPPPVPAAASAFPSTADETPTNILAKSPPPPPGLKCPQCSQPLSAAVRACGQCGRTYMEPCLSCQSANPFWLRHCRGCNADLLALKQQMLATLNSQKQQVLALREGYGHDKALPVLKQMSLNHHPLFGSYRDWAKNMTLIVQKERRDIKQYTDNVRAQAKSAFEAQKYEKVQQILEQVPRPLLDDELRTLYVEAGESLTEVDSLIREIRNAISTKQYNPLLSCVQRYLELKANDPEAKNLQERIEKLTTFTAPNGMKLRRVPSGRFYMGSHDSDEFLRNNEHPQHRVQILRSIFIGVYPVTQEEFQKVMEFNPSVSTDGPRNPVDSVSWFSAVEFCNRMSMTEELPLFYDLQNVKKRASGVIEKADVTALGGDGYRLPSEAEWEYCCRAGSITPWCFGDQILDVAQYAWYFDNSSGEAHRVGEKKPNSWGLFDMHGNMMEWCNDWFGEFYYQVCTVEECPPGPEHGVAKVLRGGAWQFGAEATRSAYRNSSNPEAISSVIGFRVCRNTVDDVM